MRKSAKPERHFRRMYVKACSFMYITETALNNLSKARRTPCVAGCVALRAALLGRLLWPASHVICNLEMEAGYSNLVRIKPTPTDTLPQQFNLS